MKARPWLPKIPPRVAVSGGILLLLLLMFLVLRLVSHSPETLSKLGFGTVETTRTSPHSVTNRHTVRADFNGDGLEDFVIAEADTSGESTISLYLRRDATNATLQYYKGGHINSPHDLEATAMMTIDSPHGQELVIILSSGDGTKDVVHYQSHDDALVEIKRERRTQ